MDVLEPYDLTQTGTGFATSGAYDQAVDAYRRALAGDRDVEEAWYGLTFALRKLGRLDEAGAALDEGLELHPTSSRLLAEQGILAYNTNDYQDAIAAFDRVLALDRYSETAWQWKSSALRMLRDWDSTERVLDEAAEVLPGSSGLRTERGLLAYDRNDYEGAITAFDEALALDATSETAWEWKASALRMLRALDGAQRVLDQARQVLPGSTRLQTEEGLLAYDRNDYDAAVAAFDRVLAVDPRAETAWQWKTTALRMQQDVEAAERALDEADAALPDSIRLRNERGLLAYDRNDYDAAIAAFDDVLALDHRNETAWKWKATSLRMKFERDEAGRVLGQALAALPDSVVLHNERGLLAYDRRDYDAAVAAFDDVLALDRRNETAWQWKTTALRMKQDFDAAQRVLDAALELLPNSVVMQTERGLFAYDRNDYDAAIAAFDEALEGDRRSATAWQWKAAALRVKREFDAAERTLDEGGQLLPNSVALYNERGYLATDRRDLEAALAAFDGALALDRHSATAWQWKAATLRRMRDFEAAGRALDEAAAAIGETDVLHNERGMLAFERRDYDGALAAFDRALARNRASSVAWDWKALILGAKNDFEGARQALDEGLAAVPARDRQTLLWRSAWLLIDDNRSDEAVGAFEAAAEAALAAGQGRADTLWELGNGMDDAKRLDRALNAWAQALAADPHHTYAMHNIASALWNEGAFREAREAWDRTRALYERAEPQAEAARDAAFFTYYGTMLMEVYDELDAARRCLEKAVALDPDDTVALVSLLELRQVEGRRYLAEQADARSTALTTRVNELFGARAPSREANGDEVFVHPHWQARELAKRAEALLEGPAPGTLPALDVMRLGDLHLQMEDNEAARESYVAALGQTSKLALEARIHRALGVLSAREEQYAAAVAHCKESLARSPMDLSTRVNLAESHLKRDDLLAAEAEYKLVIERAPRHVEAHVGLGEVYTAMADNEADPDLYSLAEEYFSRALGLADSGSASKSLKGTDRAAVLYSRGYARTALWEASGPIGGSHLLRKARADFRQSVKCDRHHHKARRALVKIERRVSPLSPDGLTHKLGPLIITSLAVGLFIFVQLARFVPGLGVDLGAADYALLTFGSLIFIVAGLSLPSLLKLKVGGIELEKSVVEQMSATSGLGIKK